MKASMKLTKPDDVEATITLTMTLAQWKLLRVSVVDDAGYQPGGKLREAIDDLVRQATKAFYSGEDDFA
jgi:hypothetical protein